MIGIFDSGVGGLTVVKEVFKHLPNYQIIYFGDTARLPYGTKGADFVKKYSDKITGWLLKKGAKAIVIACHTSSAWASESLKKKYNGVPVFEMITSAAENVLAFTKNNKVGIIGTPGTIKSKSFEKKLLKLNPKLKIYSRACPLFVPLAEEGWINEEATRIIVKDYLLPLKDKKIDTLVLACTHYPLLEKTIKKVVGNNIAVINPAESVAKEIKLFLKNNPKIRAKIKKGSKHRFVFSDEPYNFQKISHLCFNKNIKIKINDPF